MLHKFWNLLPTELTILNQNPRKHTYHILNSSNGFKLGLTGVGISTRPIQYFESETNIFDIFVPQTFFNLEMLYF